MSVDRTAVHAASVPARDATVERGFRGRDAGGRAEREERDAARRRGRVRARGLEQGVGRAVVHEVPRELPAVAREVAERARGVRARLLKVGKC